MTETTQMPPDYPASRRRVADLETLHRMGLALASHREPEALAQHAVDVVREAFGYYYAVFLTYDPATQSLRPTASGGDRRLPPKHVNFPLGMGITGLTAQLREPIIVNDVSADPRYVAGGVPHVAAEAAFPVQRGERLFGVLDIGSRECQAFDAEAVRTLTAVANQMAVALENALFLAESQRRVQALTTLAEISAALNQALTLEETLDRVLQALTTVLGQVACSVVLIDEPTGILRMVASQHMAAQVVQSFNDRPVRRDEGTFGIAICTGEVVEVADAQNDPRVLHDLAAMSRELTNVPLRTTAGVVIGVLVLETIVREADTRRLVLALADLAAVAIQRARQFEEEQRRRKEAITLREVGAAITASLDIPTILRAIYAAVAPTLNADTFYVALVDEARQMLSLEFIMDAGISVMPFTHPIDLSRGITSWVIQHRQPLLLHDVDAESPLEPISYGEAVRSSLVVPIISQERLIGVIAAQSQQPHMFDEQDQWLLSAVADQAAVALENARLYAQARRAEEALSRQVQTLTTLLDVSRKLQGPGTVAEKAQLSAQGIVDSGLFGRAVLTVLDAEEQPVAVGCAGLTPEEETVLHTLPALTPEQRRLRFQERYRVGGSYYIPHDDQLTSLPSLASQRPADSFVDWHPDDELFVPLWGRAGRLIGSLSVDDPGDGRRPTEESVRQLELFAGLAAMSLESAVLLAETQRQAQENAKLVREQERRIAGLTVLQEVGLRTTATLDLPAVLEAVAAGALRLVQASNVHLFLYDAARQSFTLGASVDDAGHHAGVLRMPRPDGLTATVARTGQPLIIADAPAHPLYQSPDARIGNLQSIAGLPIRRGDQVLGVLNVAFETPHPVTADEHQLLELLTHQAAIAIENARLYQDTCAAERDLSRQVNVLTTLLGVAHALQSLGDLQTQLDLVAQGIVDAGLWRRAVISVFDDDWRVVNMGAAGLTPEELAALKSAPTPNRAERQRLYDERFRISASYYIPHDADAAPVYTVRSHRQTGEFVDWHPHDSLLVPLYGAEGRIIGQLSVDDPVDGRRPTAESLRPLELFANQAAVAVENQRLFAELRLMNRDLEGMLEGQQELLKMVQELSSPVVPIFPGVLVMPLVGTIDAMRAQQITQAVLTAIARENGRVVIMDVTGVPVMDSHVARYLAEAMLAVRLVGAEPVLVGITPAVAQTVVAIRADLGDVTKRNDLQSGVAYALRRLGRAPVIRET